MAPNVGAAADARVVIPMRAGARSLNIGMAAAIAGAETCRQLGGSDEGVSGGARDREG